MRRRLAEGPAPLPREEWEELPVPVRRLSSVSTISTAALALHTACKARTAANPASLTPDTQLQLFGPERVQPQKEIDIAAQMMAGDKL